MLGKRLAPAAFGLASLLGLGSAHALTFQFGNTSGLPQPVIDGFNAAAARWSANINTNITVKVNIDFLDLGNSTTLGQTNVAWDSYPYQTIQQKLTSHATSADDRAATGKLPSGLTMLINRTSDSPYGAGSATPYWSDAASAVLITIPNAQALGLPSLYTVPPSIQFNGNPGIRWDFNPNDGITTGYLDFVGVATHELGHVLGFGSIVDSLESSAGQYTAGGIMPTTMDLFRFSAQSLQNSLDGVNPIDLTTNTNAKYFSIDNGTTQIAQFSTGVKYGDGYQASHWKEQTPSLGIMDPVAAYSERLNVTLDDRRLFDVIGYNLNSQWTWSGGSSTAWSDALNWPTASVPDSSISVTFAGGSTYSVQLLNQPSVAASLLVNGNTILNLDTGTTSLTIGNGIGVGSAGTGTGALTMTGSGTVTAASLTIGTGSTFNQSGGTLSIASATNSGTFSQVGGTLSVTGQFTNSAGTATFGGTQNWAVGSQLVVNGGAVQLNTDAGAGGANLNLIVNAGATANLSSTQHLKSIAINGGTAVMIGARQLLMAGDVTLDSTAQLDLGSSDMIIRSPQTTTLAQISSLIKTARDSGWGTVGITSSGAKQSGMTTLVPLLNTQDNGSMFLGSLDGVGLLPTDIIVKYTYQGDVNLDGVVNAADFAQIKYGSLNQGFLQHPVAYTDGDVDFNGVINAADFALAKYASLNQGDSLASVAVAMVVVPEPSALALLALGATGLLVRRGSARRGLRHR